MLATANETASLGTLVTQIIVGVGGFAGIATAINAVFSRRKTRAEAGGIDATAAETISNTAASQVERMDKRMAAQERKLAEQDDRIGSLEGEVRSLRRGKVEADQRERDLTSKLHEYADWCALATGTLSEHGIVISPPPSYTDLHRGPPLT